MGDEETRTVVGARAHARSQAGSSTAAATLTKPTIPARTAAGLPSDVDAENVVWDETLGQGGYASRVVKRGGHIRLAQVDGAAASNVSLVLHHAPRPAERLNVADTVKLQWNAYLGAGALLLSDMGRVLCTILGDTTAPLDLLCGANRRGREGLLLGLARHDLTRRDLPPAANLFSEVRVADDGSMRLVDQATAGPFHVTLRAELDVIVSLAVAAHPLDAQTQTTSTASDGQPLVRVTAWRGAPAAPDDPARQTSPETQRAFENTEDVLSALLVGGGP